MSKFADAVPVLMYHHVTPNPGLVTVAPETFEDHMAFLASNLGDMRERLKKHTVAFRERTIPSLNLHQVFFEDPSQVTIELNYAAAEVA